MNTPRILDENGDDTKPMLELDVVLREGETEGNLINYVHRRFGVEVKVNSVQYNSATTILVSGTADQLNRVKHWHAANRKPRPDLAGVPPVAKGEQRTSRPPDSAPPLKTVDVRVLVEEDVDTKELVLRLANARLRPGRDPGSRPVGSVRVLGAALLAPGAADVAAETVETRWVPNFGWVHWDGSPQQP